MRDLNKLTHSASALMELQQAVHARRESDLRAARRTAKDKTLVAQQAQARREEASLAITEELTSGRASPARLDTLRSLHQAFCYSVKEREVEEERALQDVEASLSHWEQAKAKKQAIAHELEKLFKRQRRKREDQVEADLLHMAINGDRS